jgi:hypothetical protein
MYTRYILIGIAFTLDLFQASDAGADTSAYKINPSYLEICKGSVCNNIPLPQIEGFDYTTNYSLRDFDNDGIPEVIATDASTLSMGINVCSLVYRIEKNNLVLIETNSREVEMCNISFYKDKIITAFRDGPTWYLDVYHYSRGVFVREMRHRNGELRTILDEKGNVVDQYMIAGPEGERWDEYKKAFATVSSSKAKLFNDANPKDYAHMYLVTGDRVALKDSYYNEEDNVLFYEIEYLRQGRSPIRKWIEAGSLKLDN